MQIFEHNTQKWLIFNTRGHMGMNLTTSVEYIRLIMNYAEMAGLNPDQVYQAAGFNPSILENAGTRISADQFIKIWDALEENNPDPVLGLHLGEKIFLFPGHIIFLLMMNAPTLKDAIDIFCKYFNLLSDIVSPQFKQTKTLAEIINDVHTEDYSASRHASEGLLAAYASVLNRISRNKIQFDSVYFTHEQPDDISEHQRIFNAPLFFNHSESKLVFEASYLRLPVILSNQTILKSLEKMAQSLQERIYPVGPWTEKVRQVILRKLNKKEVDIESIARELAVSIRNLQGQLEKEGVTYQRLLDQVRKEKAVYLLEEKNIPISEITFLLGYSEQSAFNRAFKRWMGFTPGQYRSRERGASPSPS